MIERTRIIASMRRRMTEIGFSEYTTPILTASSPEGARDFLVPSRIHPGKFYALPQAPQQFKQLLMVAGFDRYFQIAPCFRDEDPRADRLPGEFYQLDLEMSFVTQEDVWDTMEPVIRGVFEEFADGKPVTQRFPRIPYDTAIRTYGSDKPDLRNPIEMQAVTEHFAGSGFKVFARMIEADPKAEIWAIPAKTGGSRAFCDRMNAWAQSQGQPGLGYIFWRAENGALEGAGPLAKNIGEDRTEAIRTQLGLAEGDAVCNGFEIASGSIRNQKPETMVKAFELVGLSQADVEERFGGMYRAFQYGAPPHGGMAAGIDRIVMLLCGAENLREITLFPMNQQAQDLLMGAPSDPTPKQLRELHIRLNPPQ